jgi:hypothetical protein
MRGVTRSYVYDAAWRRRRGFAAFVRLGTNGGSGGEPDPQREASADDDEVEVGAEAVVVLVEEADSYGVFVFEADDC